MGLRTTFGKVFHKKSSEEKKGSGKVKEFIAKLSRGLMLPIAMLPIAGLFLGIGSAITSTANGSAVQKIIGDVISSGGNVIFNCLPVLFCIAIAITFTGDVGVAGLSSFVGWIVFCALQSAMITTYTKSDGSVIYNFLFWSGNTDQYNAIFTSNVGIQSLSTGVFGGIVVGWCTAVLYNKFKNIQLPTILGFFSGVRFIPIITFLSMIILSFLFSLLWPWIGMAFYYAGSGLSSAPAGLNSLVFGYFNRALVPFGLHHVINTSLWFSSLGGTFEANNQAVIQVACAHGTHFYWITDESGNIQTWAQILGLTGSDNHTFQGDINIYIELQQLTGVTHTLKPIDGGDITSYTLNIDSIVRGTKYLSSGHNLMTCNPGQYTSGAYIFTIFGLPAAALAMLMAAPKGQHRKVAASIVVSAAFVCFLTGITEPIEFTFLFLAPWLYWGFHAIMGAIAYMIPTIMSLYMPTGHGVHLAFSFSSGFLDFSIYGILQDAKHAGSNCWWLLIFSAVYGVIYYFMFHWAIIKFDIKTPGRGGEDKLFSKKDYLAAKGSNGAAGTTTVASNASPMNIKSNAIIKAYGGRSNIKNVDACITKLRVQVVDPKKVDEAALKSLGAKGVMHPSNESVYAVFGTEADIIKNEMKDIMSGRAPAAAEATPVAAATPAANGQTPFSVQVANNPTIIAPIGVVSNKKLKQVVRVIAPVDGEVVSTKSVKDETFANDLMGHGFAVIPSSNVFAAPISGKVTLVNNHAYAVKSTESKVEVLVHIGIDTVKLASKGAFKHHVKVGDTVVAGQPMVEANLNLIRRNHLDTITPVVILRESIGKKKVTIVKFGHVSSGDEIVTVK